MEILQAADVSDAVLRDMLTANPWLLYAAAAAGAARSWWPWEDGCRSGPTPPAERRPTNILIHGESRHLSFQ